MFRPSIIVMISFVCLSGALAHAAPPVTLTLSTKGEEMLYDKTVLTVKAGQAVTLTFVNKSTMQHNVVVVKPGKAAEVAQASIVAGDSKGWVAIGSPSIIAFTRLVDPKQSATLEFTAPSAAGDYPFICTYPGHSSTMKGVLKVK